MFAPELLQYRVKATLAGKGAGPAEFARAVRGLALDRFGAAYVAGDSEIKLFDPAGQLARRWSTQSPAFSVAVAADGSVWAGEMNQIEVFSSAGKPLRLWRDERRLGRVTAIGFGTNGQVFVADAVARVIHRFDGRGQFLNSIGGDNPTQGFVIPGGLLDFAVSASSTELCVANPGKHRVERYTAEGTLVGKIGKFTGPDETGFSGCCNPTNVTMAPGGHGVFVTEKAGPRAKRYDFAGKLEAVIDGAAFDPLSKNMRIAVNAASGHVFITDTERCRVMVFEKAARS